MRPSAAFAVRPKRARLSKATQGQQEAFCSRKWTCLLLCQVFLGAPWINSHSCIARFLIVLQQTTPLDWHRWDLHGRDLQPSQEKIGEDWLTQLPARLSGVVVSGFLVFCCFTVTLTRAVICCQSCASMGPVSVDGCEDSQVCCRQPLVSDRFQCSRH